MTVDVIIEEPRWETAGLATLAERAVQATLAHLGLADADWEVALLGCSDARITELNGTFRDKPRPTNVLSWPSEERGPDQPGARPDPPHPGDDTELGDLAMAFETCAEEARAGGLSLDDHVTHLVVHGVLHLLGYDHVEDADAELMEATEVQILADLGISDPYAAPSD